MNYHNETRAIIRQHEGPNNAITSGDIREEIGIEDSHDTHPAVRDIIRDLIEEGEPIASNGRGYYYIENDQQLDEYVERLNSRIEAIEERIDNVCGAYNDSDELDAIVSSVTVKSPEERKEYVQSEVREAFKEMEVGKGVISYGEYVAGRVSSQEEFQEVKEKFENEYKATVTVDERSSDRSDIMVDIKPLP